MFNKIKLFFFNRKWRRINRNNHTWALNIFDDSCVTVGKETYGPLFVGTQNKDAKLNIGSYCSIGPKVAFMLSNDHPVSRISTFPFKVKILGETNEAISKGNIVVEDDVWIGYGATILSGVHIGQGAVVAAGAVVTKNVAPYSIVAGVPARVIRSRFDEKQINMLIKLDFSKLDKETIKEHIQDLYQDVSEDTDLSWFPQKNVEDLAWMEEKR